MPTETSYTNCRANFAALCDNVAATRDVVIIRRRRAEAVALVAASELSRLMGTAYLLRSTKSAERLLRAIVRAKSRTLRPTSVASLRGELGLAKRD